MTIEISNSVVSGTPLNPGEETVTGQAQKNNTQPQVETGKPVDTVQITENAQRLQSLTESISSQPVVDSKRVEEASIKVQERSLEILGDAEQRLNSAEKIAEKILAFENAMPEFKDK